MAATAQGLNAYMNYPVENAEELEIFVAAARSKARAAGVPDYANNANYDLFIYALAAMHYDHRGSDLDGNAVQSIVNSFVLELRYAGEDPKKEPASGESEE